MKVIPLKDQRLESINDVIYKKQPQPIIKSFIYPTTTKNASKIFQSFLQYIQ